MQLSPSLALDEVASKITETIEGISLRYRSIGIEFAETSTGTLEFLAGRSHADKLKIWERAQMVLENAAQVTSHLPDSRIESEVETLKRIFDRIKLHPPDDFLSTLREGDIIEFYNASGFQLYHNLEWLRLTSYSLLDVVVYTFPELFERPTSVIGDIWKEALRPFSEFPPRASRMMVPIHTLRERLSAESRCFVVEFRYIAPLLDQNGLPQAIIISQKAERILDQSAANLSFL